MEKGQLLYEGKAKKIYATEKENELLVDYKNSATAFNGEKKTEIEGKGRLNNEISSLLFEKLKEEGIESHFIRKVSETEQLVIKADIFPLEVVVRNIVAGSLSKRLGVKEGTLIGKPIVEFYYKNDELGDPLLNKSHIAFLQAAEEKELQQMERLALNVNEVLRRHFSSLGVTLVDFKLEFGTAADGELILADEISPDTCRLWDAETNEKLDKDVFRRNLGSLTDAYEEILKRLGGSLNV